MTGVSLVLVGHGLEQSEQRPLAPVSCSEASCKGGGPELFFVPGRCGEPLTRGRFPDAPLTRRSALHTALS